MLTVRAALVFAVIPLLHLAQDQNDGWLSLAAMRKVAKIVEQPEIRVFEVASFYTMFNRDPIGKHHVQVCTTTPCMLRGAYDVLGALEKHLGVKSGHTSACGTWTLGEVECAGACVNAPVMSVGYDYYEDRWFMESTATWVEERFADGVNDNRQYLAFGQVGEPDTSLDLFERGGFAHYGNWPFWEHLADRYGDGIVRRGTTCRVRQQGVPPGVDEVEDVITVGIDQSLRVQLHTGQLPVEKILRRLQFTLSKILVFGGVQGRCGIGLPQPHPGCHGMPHQLQVGIGIGQRHARPLLCHQLACGCSGRFNTR